MEAFAVKQSVPLQKVFLATDFSQVSERALIRCSDCAPPWVLLCHAQRPGLTVKG
jgi:hypothetical protein